ncbi:hypothetical protein GCM10025876_32470 [Demequina litorisediminis]|uniref:Ribosome recycling factor domain-containing protein n=1 Tax=Demequina litorisediminis TaxID=1849022 RepID=A0ABQ6IGP8_9MICO|nr:hypothetical protein GCM10025876_32470 [Demequina litorisediminis]
MRSWVKESAPWSPPKRRNFYHRKETHVIDEILLEAEENMDRAIAVAKDNFATIRSGQASAAMFANITVDYYGAPTPLQQIASISVPEARMVLIAPYDASAKKDIESALRNSDLGVNPSDDGTVLRIVMPQVTEERRRDYVKARQVQGGGCSRDRAQHASQGEGPDRRRCQGRRGR